MARPNGRTSKFTPELRQKIIDRLQAGATIKATCDSVGLGMSTYHEWIEIGNAALQGQTHRRMPRIAEDRERFAEFAETTTRAIADGLIHATVAFKQGMNPSKTLTTTSETTEETKVNPKTGVLYTYRKTITRTTTTQSPGDWRAAMEYLARRDPEEWARAVAQKMDVTVQHIDMDSVKAELRRKIEAGEMTREQALQVTDNDTDLVNEFFKGVTSRVSVGKERTE